MRGLVDAEVQVDGDVEFTCEVSRDGVTDVEWRLQGLPLQSNEVTEVSVRDGCTHTLQLKGVTPEDAGTVSFHVGVHTSSAQLTVRGSGAGQAHCTLGWKVRASVGQTQIPVGGGELVGRWPCEWAVLGWPRYGGVVPHVLVFRSWGGVLGWTLGTGRHSCPGGRCCVSRCAVPEVTILEPLQDLQLNEGQDAHFRCQLSRASGQEARWALGGVPLQANEMNDITVEHGTLHLLTLHKVGSLGPAPATVLPGVWVKEDPNSSWTELGACRDGGSRAARLRPPLSFR